MCMDDCCSSTSRRDFIKLGAMLTAAGALPLLSSLQARAASEPDAPVRIGYLPITDATPLLVAHNNGLFEAEGIKAERPVLLRSWAQVIEAFISGQVNVIHLLSPMTVWAQVSEADISKLTPGMTAYFTTLAGGKRRWTSTVRQVLPIPPKPLEQASQGGGSPASVSNGSAGSQVVQYSVLLDVDNPDGALMAEMTTQVFFVAGKASQVLTVPLAALDEGDGVLSLVFADRTSGHGSYPAGRFLDAPMPDASGTVVLDFNKSYNPPCAFTAFATCPLPPPENRLDLPVVAGEKAYHFEETKRS